MALNLLIKPAYLLMVDAKIQDAVGPEAWGSYFPLLSLGVLLNILLDAGLANHMTRLVSKTPFEINGRYQSGWRTKLGLFPLYLGVLMSIGWLLGYRGESLEWLLWIGLNQALLSAVLYVRAGLQATAAHIADAWVSVTDRALLLLAMGTLLWSQDFFAIEWLLAGTTGALTISFSVGYWRLMRTRNDHRVADLTKSPMPFWENLRESWPYALLFLLMMTYHRVDAIMLERLAPNGAMQAGWYAMGYRLFEAANMIGFLFATLLLPYFTRMLREKQDIRPLATAVSQLLAIGGGSVAWVAFTFPTPFLGVFYSEEVSAASPVLPWLMLSFAIFAQGYVFSTLLTARGDLKRLNQLAFLGAVLNIGLNAYWLTHAEAHNAGIGCAAISALTQLIVVGLQTALAMAAHRGQIWWKIAKTVLIHSASAGAICTAFSRWADASEGMTMACLACCLAAGLLPGVTNYRSVSTLLSDKMNTFADS